MSVDWEAARRDPKLANVLYHDYEAATYDAKWSIDFEERCQSYVLDRFTHVTDWDGQPYAKALEIGAGTGFFLLNLMRAGVIESGTVTDLSPGMVAAAQRNAAELGLSVSGQVADAESLPLPDGAFDLVVGHAVLHHIPDLDAAFAEVLRVLRPGGRFIFAGEPTRIGNAVARRLSSATWAASTWLTQRPGLRRWARPADELRDSSAEAALEAVVDQHTFDPGELARTALRSGAVDVRTVTDELTAAWLGWPIRTLEAAVNPDRLGDRWRLAAYRSWTSLSWLDRNVFERVVPGAAFYNVSVTGVRPY